MIAILGSFSAEQRSHSSVADFNGTTGILLGSTTSTLLERMSYMGLRSESVLTVIINRMGS